MASDGYHRGYVSFAHFLLYFLPFPCVCVCVCVSLCVNFFFVKDFSGTTVPRILKFGTDIGYDKLYCVIKNQPHTAYQSFYSSIFLSFQFFFSSKISQELLCLGF